MGKYDMILDECIELGVDRIEKEILSLSQELKTLIGEKDIYRRREGIKKVMKFMGSGFDVSMLFDDMVRMCDTKDFIEKKMIYLYLISYAEGNIEKTKIVFGILCKDCRIGFCFDARIRGLALKNLPILCCKGFEEDVLKAIYDGIKDFDSYTRKTAIICMIKIHKKFPKIISENETNALYELVKDDDPSVSINAIIGLEEILTENFVFNKRMIVYLLNRFEMYNEYAQYKILELIAKYIPSTKEEMHSIINLLENLLENLPSSVVLSCIKIFLLYKNIYPEITKRIYSNIKQSLMKILYLKSINEVYEIKYCILSHIYFLVSTCMIDEFEYDFEVFYGKDEEPVYIQVLKIRILTKITTENNIFKIIGELNIHKHDFHKEISKEAIKSITDLVIKFSDSSTHLTKMLANNLQVYNENILTYTLISLKYILRKYRNMSSFILENIENIVDYVTNDKGKTVIIWICGEYGENMINSPYILEMYIREFNPNDNLKKSFVLLSASVKLFLKRAPEMHKSLEYLFNVIFGYADSVDLIDRAGFYYRLLEISPIIANQIINSNKNCIKMFYEDNDNDMLNIDNREFNSFSIVYEKPFKNFSLLCKDFMSNKKPCSKNAPTIVGANTELLALDIAEQNYFSLISNISMSGEEFQEFWENILNEKIIKRKLARFYNLEDFENNFLSESIYCIASGEHEYGFRFYFYAKENYGKVFVVETDINLQTLELIIRIKCQNPEYLKKFLEILSKPIQHFIQ
ncbi:hypothetical protein SteCoe_660 [Stentor coeruleus]|uniref:Beta-adaptin appendage C-terminal subdomain domain-containing protein n=1 Tax=Stentor coeruleus TaxID=5963 RepID=A0A1R2D3T7_9CILI|nr:hypothetical protein SteCoe_660 [Stentor coeruleus]